jgi:hypothetical protein
MCSLYAARKRTKCVPREGADFDQNNLSKKYAVVMKPALVEPGAHWKVISK